MTKRLLLTAAIGLALGTAAFAQTAADPSKTETTAPAASSAPAPTPAAQASTTPSSGAAGPDRTRIAESVARMTVKPLRGVDFSVSVGSRVPRELRVYRLPADVVQIAPQYRDHRFLVVEKDIVIVEPSANKIVAILPRDPAITTATSAAATSATPAAAPSTAPTTVTPPAAAPVAAAPVAAAPVAAAPTTAPTATTTTSPSTASAPSTSSTPAPDQSSAQSSQASAEPDRPKAKKQASRTQKARRATRDDAGWARAEVRVGQRVPDHVPLYEMPSSYYRELPAPDYRYSQRGYRTGPRARVYYEYD